jgi:hypothetical protein
MKTLKIGRMGTKGTLKLNLSSVVGCLDRQTMLRIKMLRTMTMRAYWSPFDGSRIITMARRVQKMVAPKVRKEETRDVTLVGLRRPSALLHNFEKYKNPALNPFCRIK